MTDPGHASDHGDRRAPGNARLSLFGDHQGQRDRTGRGYQEYNYNVSACSSRSLKYFCSGSRATSPGNA